MIANKETREQLEIYAATGEISKLNAAINSREYSNVLELKEKCYNTALDVLKFNIFDYAQFDVKISRMPMRSLKNYEKILELVEEAKKDDVQLDFKYKSFSDYLIKNNVSDIKSIDNTKISEEKRIELSIIEELLRLERKTYSELVKDQISKIANHQYEDEIVDEKEIKKLYKYNNKSGDYQCDVEDLMNKVENALKQYPDEIGFLANHGLDMFLERCERLEKKTLEDKKINPEVIKFLDMHYNSNHKK